MFNNVTLLLRQKQINYSGDVIQLKKIVTKKEITYSLLIKHSHILFYKKPS